MSKHHRRPGGPKKGRPLVHCLWLEKGIQGIFVQSTLTHKAILNNTYNHINLGDVIVPRGERAIGHAND